VFGGLFSVFFRFLGVVRVFKKQKWDVLFFG
jgi:hypothetical protein